MDEAEAVFSGYVGNPIFRDLCLAGRRQDVRSCKIAIDVLLERLMRIVQRWVLLLEREWRSKLLASSEGDQQHPLHKSRG